LQLTVAIHCSWVPIVDKNHMMSNKDVILNGYAFADETVAGNFAALPDLDPLLNFDESTNFRVVPNLASVKINKIVNCDVATKLDIIVDASVEILAVLPVHNMIRFDGLKISQHATLASTLV
jgi:hypothetical protein